MTKAALRKPLLVIVVFLVLLIGGLISLKELPLDLFPDISLPMLSVITFYPGAGPLEVEKHVTELIEDAASTVPNIKNIRSVSQENISAVTLEFEWGTDINGAANDLRPKLDLIRANLPEDAETPEIFKFDVSMFPIMIISIVSEDTTFDTRKIFENEIKDELGKVAGVGQIQLWGGGRKRIVKIEVNKDVLESYGIDLNYIASILKFENINIPAGEVESNSKIYTVRIPGEFKNIYEIENLLIHTPKGAKVRLADIADVRLDYERRINYIRSNGKNSLLIGILKQSGANTVQVAENLKKKLKKLEKQYEKDKVSFIEVFDSSKFIKDSIFNLTKTVLIAAILVIFVAFFFLRNIRGSIIIAVTIPTSLIVAFIFLYFIGASINLVSLSSLAIAIGMVVDNAVVVLENIFYHKERGAGRKESSLFGTQEVAQAITASTLTTIAIFLPIVIIKGLISVMFRQLAFTISIVLLTSLFIAFTLTPVLSFKFLKIKEKKGISKKISEFIEKIYLPMEKAYHSFLSFSLKHKLIVFLSATLLFIIGILPFVTGILKTEFLPESDTGQISGNFILPPGTNLEITNQTVKKLEDYIQKEVPECRIYGARAGRTEGGFASIMGMAEGDNTGFISLRLVPKKERKRSSEEIVYILNKKLKEIPGVVQGSFEIRGGFGTHFLGTAPLEIKIFGYDIKETDSISNLIKTRLEKIEGISGLSISRQSGTPELSFRFKRNILKHYGLSASGLGFYLRNAITGIKAGVLRKGGEEIDIIVRLDERARKDMNILKSISIPLANGERVPLENFGEFEETQGPLKIDRENKERVVKITGSFYGRALSEIIRDVQKVISEIKIPEGIKIEIGGSFSEQRESFEVLFFAFIIGTILVYLVMVAQFESFLHPFIIMFAVPFGIVGVSFAHLIAGIPFSVNSFIGLVMLVGIVVNNSIVLIDYINILRKRGIKLLDAVKEAGKRRLRPIIITTATTIFGLLPLALSTAEGSESWKPLGISVVGGLLVSSFISLIIVPIIYVFFERLKGVEE
ncbi:MAG: efflux RND transporter permease subunit [candidate division WOR-3 bacterium]